MFEQKSEQRRFNWWLVPLGAPLVTYLLFVPVTIYGDRVFSLLLYMFVAVPIASIAFLRVAFRKKGQQRLSILPTWVVFWGISVLLVKNDYAVRT
jgi:hypothetical protein